MKVPADQLSNRLRQAFEKAGVAPANAASVSSALIAAELDGLSSHGLGRLKAYLAQARSGKVNGQAEPRLTWTKPALAWIDACDGFAFPAVDLATEALVKTAAEQGVAAAAINNSHHAGVLGQPVERLARRGLIGLMMANSPKAIAPWGGKDGLFGTNPIAFACPRPQGNPLVIDLSLSKVARGKVMVAAQRHEPIPDDWALDADGRPTTDPEAALAGTMVPMGDAKGAQLVLMVEILAAALPAACFGFEAASFFTAEGAPPRVGQFLLAIDPTAASDRWDERIETLLSAIAAQEGTRLPGQRRYQIRAERKAVGVDVPEDLMELLA